MASSNKKFYTDVEIKSDIIIDGATPSAVPVYDASKKIKSSVTTAAELAFLSGTTSSVQTQLNSNATAISTHIANATGAHAASAISVTPSGDLSSTNAQAALVELQGDIDAIEALIAGLPSPFYYAGTWAASTNTPTLANGVGTQGATYYVTDSGTVDFGAGPMDFNAGDKVVYNGSTWDKWDQTDAVASVFGRMGTVTAQSGDYTTAQVTESGNLYFTDERAQDAVGNILADSNTVDFTYNDAGNSITADVKTQLSITSDASGIKLLNDASTPGNTKYYGTDGSGTKGFFSIPAVGSAGDIQETSFSFANNQAAPANITGFAFANGVVRSFSAQVSIFLDASTDLFENFEINGIQRGADWAISIESEGDDSNIAFTITNAGQLQYTSGNATGFTAGTMKFRALTTSV